MVAFPILSSLIRMGVFILIYIILLILSIKSRNKDGIAFLLLIFMFLVNLFRAITVGSDTINYYRNQFYGEFNLLDFSSNYELEWIFQSISAFIRQSDLDPRWCLFSLSIVTYFFVFLSYKRYRKQIGGNLILFLLFYFVFDYYGLSFNIARQMSAVSILLYAYSFLYDRNPLRFFIFVVIASGFHISSLSFLFLYFTRNIKIEKVNSRSLIIFTYSLLIIIFIGKIYFIDILILFIPQLAGYEGYLTEVQIGSFSILSFLLESFRVGIALYVLLRLNKLGISRYSTLFYFAIIGFIISDSFYGNMTRIFHGINIIRVACFTALFSRKDMSNNDKLIYIITVLFYGLFVLAGLDNGAYEVVPYDFEL